MRQGWPQSNLPHPCLTCRAATPLYPAPSPESLTCYTYSPGSLTCHIHYPLSPESPTHYPSPLTYLSHPPATPTHPSHPPTIHHPSCTRVTHLPHPPLTRVTHLLHPLYLAPSLESLTCHTHYPCTLTRVTHLPHPLSMPPHLGHSHSTLPTCCSTLEQVRASGLEKPTPSPNKPVGQDDEGFIQ